MQIVSSHNYIWPRFVQHLTGRNDHMITSQYYSELWWGFFQHNILIKVFANIQIVISQT